MQNIHIIKTGVYNFLTITNIDPHNWHKDEGSDRIPAHVLKELAFDLRMWLCQHHWILVR